MRGVHLRGGVGSRLARSCFRLRSRATAGKFAVGTTLAIAIQLLWVPVWAQQVQNFSLKVAPITHVAPSSETRLSIQVEPVGALPKNSFVRIRGLPAIVAISNGHAVAPGAWHVPLDGLQNLKI